MLSVRQLSGRQSLRGIVDNVSAQQRRLYHMGATKLSRSNLSRTNDKKTHELYEALFGILLKRCQGLSSGHGFRFKNELYSMDASAIDLCLSVFPWASFRKAKGGIELHVAMNHKANLRESVTMTEARKHEVAEGRSVSFPNGSIIAIDRGYTDYQWYKTLPDKGVYFVTRSKNNATTRMIERREVDRKSGLRCDQTIEFTGLQTSKRCPIALRRVGYKDSETGTDMDCAVRLSSDRFYEVPIKNNPLDAANTQVVTNEFIRKMVA